MQRIVNLTRATVLSLFALAILQGCSLDLPSPTAWLGSDDDTKTKDGEFPSLSEVPDRPKNVSSQADKRKSAESLAADGNNANYTAETLRGDGFSPAYAPQPASSITEPPDEAKLQPEQLPQVEQSTGDEESADDQRSELAPVNNTAALAPAPPAQPSVPVDVREMEVQEMQAQATQTPDASLEPLLPVAAAEREARPARATRPRTDRKLTLSSRTYTSKISDSAVNEDDLRKREVKFAESSWTPGADLPRRSGQARINLLIDGAGAESRNRVFENQLAGSAVITDPLNRLAAFSPASDPVAMGAKARTQVAARERSTGRSASLDREDRRYTAALLDGRGDEGQQWAADRETVAAIEAGEAVVLARTNASGFTLSAAETQDQSIAMATSVARAEPIAAPERDDDVPPFKTLTFARATAPDLSELRIAASTQFGGEDSATIADQQITRVAAAEPVTVAAEGQPEFAAQSDPQPTGSIKEEAQPPEITLFFAEGDVRIEAADETDLERIADAQQQVGGAVRVVTHIPAASAEAQQSSQLSLQDSLARARAVSQRMMKLGVHPTAVVVETRFDDDETASQIAQNADSNLRVEIFLE